MAELAADYILLPGLKQQRNYVLTIDLTEQPIDAFLTSSIKVDSLVIEPPFTIEFDIIRNILSSSNTSSIRIYNLSAKNRNQIYKDPFTTSSYRGIRLRAGYQDVLPTIFKGNINRAYSVREGVNYITTVECYDGGFAFVNAETSKEFPKGTSYNAIFDHIVSTMPKVEKGTVGNFPGTIARGNSLSGNSKELADELSGGAFFVDLEKAYFLGDNECIEGGLPIINAATGLLATPKKEGTILTVDILFEPRLMIGQLIELNSVTNPVFNGKYKVISLHHRGTISDAICGDATTSVGLWAGTQKLNTVASGP